MVAWTIPISNENPPEPVVNSPQHWAEQHAGILGLDPVHTGRDSVPVAGVVGWDVRGPMSIVSTEVQELRQLQV